MNDALTAGLGVDEFWERTPGEVFAIIDTDNRRMRRYFRLAATHASWVMQPHLAKNKRLTADDLLGNKGIDVTAYGSIGEAIKRAKEQPENPWDRW